MIILYFIAGVFLIFSILFFTGRGAFLISGYNTASTAEKQQYKQKRLTKVMSISTGIIALLLLCYAIFDSTLPDWGFALLGVIFLANIIVMIVLMHTYAKRKPGEEPDEVVGMDAKTKKQLKIFLAIFIPVFVSVIGIVLFVGNIGVTIEEEQIVLTATGWGNHTIEGAEIETVTYSESFEYGSRTGGVRSMVHLVGNFRNSTLGDYILYAYAGCDSAVIITTKDNIVVVNAKTEEETKQLLEQIQQVVQ